MTKMKFELTEEEDIMFDYYKFADKWGWTPDQVNALSWDQYEYFSLIMEISRTLADNKALADAEMEALKKGKGRSS